MTKRVLGATVLALLIGVSGFSLTVAVAQNGGDARGNARETKKKLDDQHLTPIRPIRRVGDDSWPSAKNQATTRETTGQSAKDTGDTPRTEDTAQNKDTAQTKDTARNTSKPDTRNSSLGNQSPPPDRPEHAAKQDTAAKRDDVNADARAGSRQAQQPPSQKNGQDKREAADRDSGDRKDGKGFASIRLGTDESGRVAVNDDQQRQIAKVMRKHHVDTVNVKVSVGSVAPANVKLGAVSADLVEILPQFRGYSFFATGENIVIVDPSSRKVAALIPVKLAATASRDDQDRDKQVTVDRSRKTPRSRTAAKEREATVGQGVPTEAEILAAPVVRGPAGTTVTRTYRTYHYDVAPPDTVIIERRRPGFFPFW